MFDQLGRTVLTDQQAATSIDISHLETGVYVMLLTIENGETGVTKVIKE